MEMRPPINRPYWKRTTIAYLVVSVLVLLANALHGWLPWMIWLVKPLIIPVLAYGWWVSSQGDDRLGHQFYAVALAGSWVGDIALMFSGQGAFIVGLIGFLVGHIGFIGAFTRPGPPTGKKKSMIRMYLLLAGYTLVLLWMLWPYLGALRVPVVIYAAVLATMVGAAFSLNGRVRTQAYPWLAGGAAAFLLSDSFLAWNKFAVPLSGSYIWIMVTYLFAEYAMLRGWIIHTTFHASENR